jgi:hypothetical protein
MLDGWFSMPVNLSFNKLRFFLKEIRKTIRLG